MKTDTKKPNVASVASGISNIKTIVVSIAALVGCIFAAGGAVQYTRSEIKSYQERLTTVETANKDLSGHVTALQDQVDEMRKGLSGWPNAQASEALLSGVKGGDENRDSSCRPGQYVVGIKSNAASTVKSLFGVTVLCQPLNLGNK